MTQEALKLALDALIKLTDVFLDTEGRHGDYEWRALDQGNKAIAAIKEALAQPEQEPTSGLHSCPYAEEIHGDYETLCDCDEEATRQCAEDI